MPTDPLLSLDEIIKGLEREFPGSEWKGYRLRPSALRPEDIDRIEDSLNAKLPESFREVASRYDLGDLSIANVWFGSTGDYGEFLIQQNEAEDGRPVWWTGRDRPKDLLLVAATDGYVTLLDVKSGRILALPRAADGAESLQVARSLELFLRGLGTIYLTASKSGEKERIAETVAEAVEGQPGSRFWKELALGYT